MSKAFYHFNSVGGTPAFKLNRDRVSLGDIFATIKNHDVRTISCLVFEKMCKDGFEIPEKYQTPGKGLLTYIRDEMGLALSPDFMEFDRAAITVKQLYVSHVVGSARNELHERQPHLSPTQ